MNNADKSNGYEQLAQKFIAGRGQNHSGVGASVVAEWSRLLPPQATVLDLGCGTGVPISETLLQRGFQVYGIDASPSMVAAFQARFPSVPVQCAAVEESNFFGLGFDGVIAWGLLFLLGESTQRQLLTKIAGVLPSGGRLLFTAPQQVCSWADAMTGQVSVSLGFDEYRKVLEPLGMPIVETYQDEGDNFYYSTRKI